MRARFSKTSISLKRWLVAAFMFIFLVIILSIEISPFGYLAEVGKPSKKTVIAPRTVQYVDKTKTREQQDVAAAAVPPGLRRAPLGPLSHPRAVHCLGPQDPT